MTPISPFRVNVPDDVLAAIRAKVAAYDWHEMPRGERPDDSWEYGTNLDFMKRLCDYWVNHYDWRHWEKALNRWPQFTAPVNDMDLHFYFEKGSGPSPRPLLLLHGWPGSVFEFLELIGPLAHPEEYGGNREDAFTVIVPSLPGYGFSGKPKAPIGSRVVAGLMDKLMREALGFEAYMAQGGDWGSVISGWLGYEADACTAIHLNMMGWSTPGVAAETEEEKQYFSEWQSYRSGEIAYAELQRTKPQTLSFAMMDSPVGVCAWIVEKFHTWSDTRKGFENVYSFDQLLTNVMIYLVTKTFNTASWLYYGLGQDARSLSNVPEGARIEKPVAIANFPYEFMLFPPRSFVERNMNVAQWTDFSAGGHFPALECGDVLVEDIRQYGRLLNY